MASSEKELGRERATWHRAGQWAGVRDSEQDRSQTPLMWTRLMLSRPNIQQDGTLPSCGPNAITMLKARPAQGCDFDRGLQLRRSATEGQKA